MKDCGKNKGSLHLHYWDVNNLYGWAKSEKLLVNKFEWIEYTFKFNGDFIKQDNEKGQKGYFFEVDV